jgi:predicted nucleotidyltransferase
LYSLYNKLNHIVMEVQTLGLYKPAQQGQGKVGQNTNPASHPIRIKRDGMSTTLADCQLPQLAEPFRTALQQAVAYILWRYEALGIIVGGSILRGAGHANSDLDIYVVHAAQFRQRSQKFFNGVPTEIFVNPPHQVRCYFVEEHADARPITAHIFTTGHLLLERDRVVEQLRQEAGEWLKKTPTPSSYSLTMLRYSAATLYEDALDVVTTHPETASLILDRAVYSMLQYRFWQARRFLPRDKDLLDAVGELDDELPGLGKTFYVAPDLATKVRLAEQIAAHTIQASGFFEWEEAPEDV